jgi:hypothetical protein
MPRQVALRCNVGQSLPTLTHHARSSLLTGWAKFSCPCGTRRSARQAGAPQISRLHP